MTALAGRYRQAQIDSALSSPTNASAVVGDYAVELEVETDASSVDHGDAAVADAKATTRAPVRFVGDPYYAELYDLSRPAPPPLKRRVRPLDRSSMTVTSSVETK
jgi:hypothetical protein